MAIEVGEDHSNVSCCTSSDTHMDREMSDSSDCSEPRDVHSQPEAPQPWRAEPLHKLAIRQNLVKSVVPFV